MLLYQLTLELENIPRESGKLNNSLTSRREEDPEMILHSDTFTNNGPIPQSMVYEGGGCTGGNRSPQLSWSDVPAGTRSFAIVIHDPDAPTSGGFYHWVMFNIPGDARELAEGAGNPPLKPPVRGAVLGHTDFGENAYGGPCPPPGPAHHYHVTLYALDVDALPLDKTTTGAKLEFVVSQHTRAKATIIGLYARPKE